MIITAESGASKTDWIIDGKRFRTKGINCSVMSADDIASVVACLADGIGGMEGIRQERESRIQVNFYGAGLVTEDQKKKMAGILDGFFPGAEIKCDSDLLAAARALWGDSPGIAAILGTGSNSCSYNGSYITENVRPGGYVLGDEGGGAALGRMFLSDYIKDMVPSGLAERFREEYKLKYSDIVTSVYRSPNPAGFLASFAPFIIDSASGNEYSANLVKANLEAFVTRSLLRYRKEGGTLHAGVVGAVGTACRQWLADIGEKYDVDFCRFITSPIEALAEYHSRKNPIFASATK